MMIMSVENAVKQVTFDEIEQGNFFSPCYGNIYLKIEEQIGKDGFCTNAIDMEGGHLAHFDKERYVYPVDAEISIKHVLHNFTIEN